MKQINFIKSAVLFQLLITVCSSLTFPPKRFLTKKYQTVNGRRMTYVEVGKGDPIVFLHGNPTSSFLWRNVMPHLEGQGRLIAPDLIGMGNSEKLPPGDPSRYITLQHSNYLFGLLEKLGVKSNVILVLHDWGSVLGFLWAYQRRYDPGAIKGIAFMESFVVSFTTNGRPDLSPFFQLMRSPAGEQLVLQDNIFIEQGIPSGIIRNLTVREMNEYRRPFLNPGEDRRPMLTFPRQVPFDGVPSDTSSIISSYSKWLGETTFPKLLISANPGVLIKEEELELARSWPNLKEISVNGLHYIQEDVPDEIGAAISKWLKYI